MKCLSIIRDPEETIQLSNLYSFPLSLSTIQPELGNWLQIFQRWWFTGWRTSREVLKYLQTKFSPFPFLGLLAGLLPSRELRFRTHPDTSVFQGPWLCCWTLELLIVITYSNQMLNCNLSPTLCLSTKPQLMLILKWKYGRGAGSSSCCSFDSGKKPLTFWYEK